MLDVIRKMTCRKLREAEEKSGRANYGRTTEERERK